MFWSLVSFGDLPKKANEAWQMQSGVLQDLKRHGSKKPCWCRSLEGLGTLGRLGLKGLLLSCIPTYCLVDRFTAWRAAERFFAEFFDFLFDITLPCYLVFASLFSYSYDLLYCFLFMFMH